MYQYVDFIYSLITINFLNQSIAIRSIFFPVRDLKELCHHISVFLLAEARWGSPLSNQVCGRCGLVTSRSRHLPMSGRPSQPCACDWVCTLALTSEIDFASVLKDAEGPAYLSLR